MVGIWLTIFPFKFSICDILVARMIETDGFQVKTRTHQKQFGLFKKQFDLLKKEFHLFKKDRGLFLRTAVKKNDDDSGYLTCVGIQLKSCVSNRYFLESALYIPNYSLHLQSLVPKPPFARGRMKRESGENPEQSRCCEPHLHRLSLLNSLATAYINKGGKAK